MFSSNRISAAPKFEESHFIGCLSKTNTVEISMNLIGQTHPLIIDLISKEFSLPDLFNVLSIINIETQHFILESMITNNLLTDQNKSSYIKITNYISYIKDIYFIQEGHMKYSTLMGACRGFNKEKINKLISAVYDIRLETSKSQQSKYPYNTVKRLWSKQVNDSIALHYISIEYKTLKAKKKVQFRDFLMELINEILDSNKIRI